MRHTVRKTKRPCYYRDYRADDMGYSDITPFGGEIPTPNLQAMAENGDADESIFLRLPCLLPPVRCY